MDAKRVPVVNVSLRGDGLYYCDGQPFTGTTFTEYPGGAPRSEIEYREGLRWGRSREWYKNGAPSCEAEFERDVQHGTAREWSPEGTLESEVVCEYGVTVSERRWDEDGNLAHDFQLKETNPAYETLARFRRLYGTTNA